MKVRIEIPQDTLFKNGGTVEFVDEVLAWAKEAELDAEFYAYHSVQFEPGIRDRRRWAIFIVENDMSFMFSLKWGALAHKGLGPKMAK